MNRRIFLTAALLLTMLAAQAQSKGPAWLSGAVFYQIYPSSYQDSNGDGKGDLPGITSRLDYIKSLGVNAIWLGPVCVSGWFDGGYDVIDYYRIDPRFGTNTDLVHLVDEAHRRGIKVIMDLVAGHTSNRCAWFQQSAQGRDLRYSDYYIWSDSISAKEADLIAQRNATPDPQSSKLGKWVEADAPRGKYYQKNYYMCQPALNYGYARPNPKHPWEQATSAPGPQAVRRELHNIMAFWMDKGVDGFRVDMAASLVKGDSDKQAIKALWHEMRQWMQANYPQCILVSEWNDPEVAIPAGFNIDFCIHIGKKKVYNTLFFGKESPYGTSNANGEAYFDRKGAGSLDKFMAWYVPAYEATKSQGYITFPTANHDFQRPNAGTRNTLEQLKVSMTFSLTMPGVPFIYYGDEIAMPFQDGLTPKEGSRNRAGSRTPMQWTTGMNAGFSTCVTDSLYFPIDTQGGHITVESEERDPNSMLHYVRTLLQLRRECPALGNDGDFELLNTADGPQYPMVYLRRSGGQTLLVALNPSGRKVSLSTEQGAGKVRLLSGKGSYRNGQLRLNPFTAMIVELQ